MADIGGSSVRLISKIKDAIKENNFFKEFWLFHEQCLGTGLQQLDEEVVQLRTFTNYVDKKVGGRKHYKKLFMDHLLNANEVRTALNTKLDEMVQGAGQEDNTRSLGQIKSQKRQVLNSLGPYKGKQTVELSKIKDRDMSNFMNHKQQNSAVHNLVSQKELNHLKRINYGDYFIVPSQFDSQIKKMEQKIGKADGQFKLKIRSNKQCSYQQ